MKRRRISTAVLSLALAALAAFCFIFAYPALSDAHTAEPLGYTGILRLWHIDGFEGGMGSRASFLARVAGDFEKRNEGTLVMVVSHTPESARQAINEGKLPEMISFGGDCSFVLEAALPLEGYTCAAASVGGATYAVPWCRGGYLLFSAEGDFSDISAENTVISQGRGSVPYAAAALEGMRGDFALLPSVQAYTALIGGKYKYMLGTQRDVYRFITRGFSVSVKPVESYCDLWQYICVCAGEAQKYEACLRFMESLLSETVQKSLSSVGMLSPYCSVYGEENAAMRALESISPAKTLFAFADAGAREAFASLAEGVLKGDENGAKKLENYLV